MLYATDPLATIGGALSLDPACVGVARSSFAARPKKTLSGTLEIGLEEAGCEVI